ncbi:Ubiquitin system component Cue, partial [Cynara cardunculus var. scolymus]
GFSVIEVGLTIDICITILLLVNPSQAASTSTSNNPSPSTIRHRGHGGGSVIRTPPHVSDDDLSNILAMAETVREVLPHVPDELILRDLQRTNSVSVTVKIMRALQLFGSLVDGKEAANSCCLVAHRMGTVAVWQLPFGRTSDGNELLFWLVQQRKIKQRVAAVLLVQQREIRQ